MTDFIADNIWIPATALCLLILLAVVAVINRVDRRVIVDRNETGAGFDL